MRLPLAGERWIYQPLGASLQRYKPNDKGLTMSEKDISGIKFNHLTGLKRDHSRSSGIYWFFRCECGKEKSILKHSVVGSITKSCGCKSGFHGLTYTPEYCVWESMKKRCLNKNNHAYPRYGGRGITVCKRWLESAANFVADMGLRPSDNHQLDRIDNNKGYYKENCRWVLPVVNSKNKRNSKYWIIGNTIYDDINTASINENVSRQTIKNWCDGKLKNGVLMHKKINCHSVLKSNFTPLALE